MQALPLRIDPRIVDRPYSEPLVCSSEEIKPAIPADQKQNQMLIRELAALHSTTEQKLVIVPRFFFFVNNTSGARIKYQHGSREKNVFTSSKQDAMQSSPVNCVFEVVLSPLLKTLLQRLWFLSVFSMFSPLFIII